MRAAARAALIGISSLLCFSLTHEARAISMPAADLNVDTPEFDVKRPPKGTRVQVVAEILTYNSKTKIATAKGRVVLVYGPYVMIAENVSYDQARDILRATGQIRLREPGGNILETDLLELQNKFRDGFAEHLRLLLTNDATITAEYARRQNGVITVFERATYTGCKTCVLSDGTPLWEIRSKVATHDKEKHEIRHEDMTFEFLGVPIFWLPEFAHTDGTVKRRSGFLTPELSLSQDIGVGVTIPYYWALAPSYDITFLPLITSDQGIMPRAVWRQRTKTGEYFVDGAGIYQLNPDGLSEPGDRRWRGSVHSAGKFSLNQNWTWGWDATAMSDDTFMRRYNVDSREEIVSEGFITGIDDRNFFRARAMHFRNLIVDDEDHSPLALPYIEHDYTFDRPVLGGELGITSSVYNLYRDDNEITQYPGVVHGEQQSRATTTLHWQRQFVSSIGTLATPFTRLRADVYYNKELPEEDLLGTQSEQNVSRMLPSAGLDLRWPFVHGSSYGQHVVTPVTQFITASDETDEDEIGNEDAIDLNFDTSNLFLHQKFSGEDRYEGGTRVNAGVLYSYLMDNGGFLRASIGESFHLAGENSFDAGSGLEDARSDLVTALAFQPSDHLRFTYQARFDHERLRPAVQDAGADMIFDRWTLSGGLSDVEDAAAYGRPTDELQAWAYATLQLTGGWSVFGGLRYDFERDLSNYETVGLAFNCECFQFKVAYVSNDNEDDGDLDKSHSVMFTVKFKGLSNDFGQ
jgi:LPS-assembly protein